MIHHHPICQFTKRPTGISIIHMIVFILWVSVLNETWICQTSAHPVNWLWMVVCTVILEKGNQHWVQSRHGNTRFSGIHTPGTSLERILIDFFRWRHRIPIVLHCVVKASMELQESCALIAIPMLIRRFNPVCPCFIETLPFWIYQQECQVGVPSFMQEIGSVSNNSLTTIRQPSPISFGTKTQRMLLSLIL